MRHIKKIAPVVVLALLTAGVVWACKAGNSGSSASNASSSEAAAKCPYHSQAEAAKAAGCPFAAEASHAKMVEAGGHCGMSGKSAEAMAHDCGVKAGDAVYSFAVPGAECENCIRSIQKATMAMKGVDCAHVDLSTHTAYIIASKNVNQKALAQCIQEAGFKNTYKGMGPKVQAAFVEAMKNGAKNGMSCCPLAKEKDKA